ncbi:uncharacterized protein LOC133121244 [Conger conger]|uniref:uncharacterized protein LOC133121244 n=1 Tax=Conger conger TaxID=82655 RepID=UPI002A5AF1A8|nr:uncharacterized protein LOC133121244 [Conger conger]
MSGRCKSRSRANATSMSGSVSIDERILRECHQIYTDTDNGLISIARSVGLNLLPPRKKITVMLMGNHSAGKSSFINWYVDEHIQRTGVAIETQGFSFVTSGRKRESLMGKATLFLHPHFKHLQDFKGVSEYLTTEICTSRQKRFSLVTFVDTPGLVDGYMKYPFDVDQAILWLGNACDLILVFFDPMGQALCKRTMNLVEKLNESQGEKLRFYMSKADEAGSDSDRQRVLMQIVQELCKRPGLNKCGFDMPTIYIPNPNKPSCCVNQIEEVCKTLEKTINQTVQMSLNSLENDCEVIICAITDKLNTDRQHSADNSQSHCIGCMLCLLGSFLLFMLLAVLLLGGLSNPVFQMALGEEGREALTLYLVPVMKALVSMPIDHQLYCCGGLVMVFVTLLILACLAFRTRPTMSGWQKRQLKEKLDFVEEVLNKKKRKLYEDYLRQSLGEHDMV